MSNIWDLFTSVNELAYAVDVDSHEIVYMNCKALETYGVSDVKELKGKKCYEVFCGNGVPCAKCNNELLSEGEFRERKYYDSASNRYFLLMETMVTENGRRCRFEFSIDISENENSRRTLDRHENLEACVNEGIKRAICELNPDKSIDIILEFLGEVINGERVYVFEKNSAGGDDNTYEWTAEGVTPEKDNLQDVPPEVCANWYRYFNENKNIMFDDIEKMKYDDPLVYETLRIQNIHSIVVVPLYDDNHVIGFYGIDNPPKEDMEDTLNMLRIVGYFISSMLKRRDMLNQLREISLHDQLTKLGNRYALNEYSSNIEAGKNLGVVYCDITGLKRMNDTMGHDMGDALICRASECLKRAFGEYGLFRIGGDELLALCVDIDKDILQKRIDFLRRDSFENSVNLAIGVVLEEKYGNNLQELIREAEKKMYREKEIYYKLTGIDRRK